MASIVFFLMFLFIYTIYMRLNFKCSICLKKFITIQLTDCFRKPIKKLNKKLVLSKLFPRGVSMTLRFRAFIS